MLYRTEYKANLPKVDLIFDDFKTAINQPTGNFFYDTWKIKEKYIGTIWENLLKSLPEPHGEARVITMQPGTTYMAHTDIDNRWHLNLQGEQSYLIDLENLNMHLLTQDAYWYYMDAGRVHVASNYGSITRIQLVVRQLLYQSEEEDLVTVTINPSSVQHDYRYKFDNIVSPWLNRANINKKIRDFNVDNETVTFKTSLTEISKLTLSQDFKIEIRTVS